MNGWIEHKEMIIMKLALKRILFVFFITIGMLGCQSSRVFSDNPLQSGDSIDSFGLTTEDFDYAAKQAVESFIASPTSLRRDGSQWRVTIGEVVNDTTFRINTKSMTSRMRDMLINSGKFSFSGFTGQDGTSFLRDSQQLSKSTLVDQKSVAKGGTALAPNLQINGEIRQRTNVSGDRSRQRLEYEFDFRATDVTTGQLAFSKIIDIRKTGSNKNFAW